MRWSPAVWALSAALSAGTSLASCPTNHVAAGPVSNDAALPADGRSYNSCNVFGGCGTASAGYSIPNGSPSISFSAHGDYFTGADARMQDDFIVVGIPAGTAVSLVAHLHATVTGMFPSGNHVSSAIATLADGNGNEVSVGAPPSTDQDLMLALAVVAGEPFRLVFDINGSTQAASGGGSGAFSFSGLPPGAGVTSCNGYVSDPSVALRRSSWGRIMGLYR